MSVWDLFKLVLLAWGTVAAYYALAWLSQSVRSIKAQRRDMSAAAWDRHTVSAGVTPIRYTDTAVQGPRLRAVK